MKTPEEKAEYHRGYAADPINRARRMEQDEMRKRDPEFMAQQRAYWRHPKNKSRNAANQKRYREAPEEKLRHSKDSSDRYHRRNWKALSITPATVDSFKRIVVSLLIDEALQRREKRRVSGTKYAKANPEKVKLHNYTQSKKHAVRILAGARKRMYGLSTEQYLTMFESQEGRCAVCEAPLLEKYHTDHCHVTGVVRGLLCRGCNMGLGFFKDSIPRMKSAVVYLEKFEAKEVK